MLRYPVKLLKDTNDTILVDVPDVPEAHTFGEDRAEALLRAPDAIESALMAYIDLRRDIPVPRAGGRGPFVTLPALAEAKLALYTAMRTAKVGKAELARRLNCHLPQVDRRDRTRNWVRTTSLPEPRPRRPVLDRGRGILSCCPRDRLVQQEFLPERSVAAPTQAIGRHKTALLGCYCLMIVPSRLRTSPQPPFSVEESKGNFAASFSSTSMPIRASRWDTGSHSSSQGSHERLPGAGR